MSSVQMVVLLDVDAPVDVNAVTAHIPHERRERKEFRLTDHGYNRAEAALARDQLDWVGILAAMASLVRALEAQRPRDGEVVEIYVSGLAPLSVFFACGTLLDSRTSRVTTINQRRNEQTWDVLPYILALPPSRQVGAG